MLTIPWTGWPWIASHPIAYPALEVVHTIGIAMLVGSLLLLELRVWGRGAQIPILPLARLALPVSVGGFVMVACSGLLMFAANPGEMIANRAFLLKMVLVMLAGCNAAAFHMRDGLARADAVARAQTALSLGIWVVAIISGRWIAYV